LRSATRRTPFAAGVKVTVPEKPVLWGAACKAAVALTGVLDIMGLWSVWSMALAPVVVGAMVSFAVWALSILGPQAARTARPAAARASLEALLRRFMLSSWKSR
jgi:hypothetical protein